MSITITLPEPMESSLRNQARERSMAVEELVEQAVVRFLGSANGDGADSAATRTRNDEEKAQWDSIRRDHPRELAAYERMQSQLEREHNGKVALFHEDELVEIFTEIDDAIDAGYERYGSGSFFAFGIGDHSIEMFIGFN